MKGFLNKHGRPHDVCICMHMLRYAKIREKRIDVGLREMVLKALLRKNANVIRNLLQDSGSLLTYFVVTEL